MSINLGSPFQHCMIINRPVSNGGKQIVAINRINVTSKIEAGLG